MGERNYTIDIDPKILKFLGPSLYTNVYYVLSELIANAWDADATNVYIIEKDDVLIVEDNGIGMSYSDGGISNYLRVAEETRTDDNESFTISKRPKMGRKGIGKLSALAAAPIVKVLTIKNNEKSGFILTRDIDSTGRLEEIPQEEIKMEIISDHGTSIQMMNPEYKLNRSIDVVARNITKLFPVISESFQITIINKEQKTITLSSFDHNIIPELASLITLGKEFEHLKNYYTRLPGFENDYYKTEMAKSVSFIMPDKNGNNKEVDLIIKGWIGAYRSTKDRRAEQLEFPDNYLSIYCRGKLGEFNIIPRVGSNRLPELFVVGQLHIDLFDDTSLPDMALSNRQGYRDDDIRYVKAMEIAEQLLKDVTNLRTSWANEKSSLDEKKKIDAFKEKEEAFKKDVDSFKLKVATDVSLQIEKAPNDHSNISRIVSEVINANSSLLGLKPIVDANKKRILISHTSKDKDMADLIYSMLLYNNVENDDIIYTSCDNEKCRIPNGYSIYDYLREFFVESYSNARMCVIYVTSQAMSKAWGAVVEVGASWITKMNHSIFNLNIEEELPNTPQKPLDVDSTWQTTRRSTKNELVMSFVDADILCSKIEDICDCLSIRHKTREENMSRLKKMVIIE